VPDNSIPAGYTPPHHHAAHHVVGRIKQRIHHKFVHLGPPSHAPIPEGCEKHAIAGPGGGRGLPAGPAAPISKAAAVGGAGAGLVALGGLGGIGGGFFGGTTPPGEPSVCSRTTIGHNGKIVCVSTTGTPPTVPTTPTTPVVPPTTPVVPPVAPPVTPPGTPPTSVPEPSAIALFLVGAAAVMLIRHMGQRRLARAPVRAG
jgi:hypothetical protein